MVITREAHELETNLTLRLSAGRFPCEIVWREPSGKMGVRFIGGKFIAADLNRMMGAQD
jgi:hypothetical protein